jgi:2'-5' RNA ligase
MSVQVHRLFFALRPDAAVRENITQATAQLKATQGVRARWLDPAKLHMTVQFLGDFAEPGEIVQRAQDAAASLHVASFQFTLDRVVTFARRFKPPCVLRCATAAEAPLQALWRELGAALRDCGLGAHIEQRPYIPHLTVAYAERVLPEAIAIEPISWLATELSLLESLVGPAVHKELGRWPLRA